MKSIFLLIILFSSLYTFGQMQKVPSPFPNPGNLEGYIHTSIKDSLNGKVPLVVVLHGCTQNAAEIAHDSEWNVLADKYGFHVLYPEQNRRNNVSNCFNWFEDNDSQKNKGECLSIERMIREVINTYSIDTTQIYLYGVSAGSALAAAMMINYPDLINAGACLAGVPAGVIHNAFDVAQNIAKPKDYSMEELVSFARIQNPTYKGNYPRMFIYHGTKDYVVPIQSGYELAEQFLGLHDLTITPTKTERNFKAVDGLTRNSFQKDGKELVVFYELKDWGHAIMVKPGSGVEDGGETGSFSKIGGIWSTLQIAKDFGLIK